MLRGSPQNCSKNHGIAVEISFPTCTLLAMQGQKKSGGSPTECMPPNLGNQNLSGEPWNGHKNKTFFGVRKGCQPIDCACTNTKVRARKGQFLTKGHFEPRMKCKTYHIVQQARLLYPALKSLSRKVVHLGSTLPYNLSAMKQASANRQIQMDTGHIF